MNTSNPHSSSEPVFLQHIIRGLAAGAGAGLMAGATARISMRVIALAAGMRPDFSLEGTLFILIAFAVLGAPLGCLYAGTQRRYPLPHSWRGLAFGAALLLIAAVPLLLAENLEGELALIGPWTIIAAFAPVFLGYGWALGKVLRNPWLHSRLATNRQIRSRWLLPFSAAVIFSLASMGTLNEFGLPFPRAIATFYRSAGISYNVSRDIRAFSVLLLRVSFLGSAGWLFFSRSNNWMPRFAAVAMLTFAGGFFASRDVFLALFGTGELGQWLGGLVRAGGLTGLLLLIYLFPDGRFAAPWTRVAAGLWSATTLLWFLPLGHSVRVPDSSLAIWVLLGLGSGLIAQWQRYRQLNETEARRQVAPVLKSLAATWILTAVVWIAALSFPPYLAIGSPRMPLFGLFAFAPYLLPWLFLPLSLAFSYRYRGLWR